MYEISSLEVDKDSSSPAEKKGATALSVLAEKSDEEAPDATFDRDESASSKELNPMGIDTRATVEKERDELEQENISNSDESISSGNDNDEEDDDSSTTSTEQNGDSDNSQGAMSDKTGRTDDEPKSNQTSDEVKASGVEESGAGESANPVRQRRARRRRQPTSNDGSSHDTGIQDSFVVTSVERRGPRRAGRRPNTDDAGDDAVPEPLAFERVATGDGDMLVRDPRKSHDEPSAQGGSIDAIDSDDTPTRQSADSSGNQETTEGSAPAPARQRRARRRRHQNSEDGNSPVDTGIQDSFVVTSADRSGPRRGGRRPDATTDESCEVLDSSSKLASTGDDDMLYRDPQRRTSEGEQDPDRETTVSLDGKKGNGLASSLVAWAKSVNDTQSRETAIEEPHPGSQAEGITKRDKKETEPLRDRPSDGDDRTILNTEVADATDPESTIKTMGKSQDAMSKNGSTDTTTGKTPLPQMRDDDQSKLAAIMQRMRQKADSAEEDETDEKLKESKNNQMLAASLATWGDSLNKSTSPAKSQNGSKRWGGRSHAKPKVKNNVPLPSLDNNDKNKLAAIMAQKRRMADSLSQEDNQSKRPEEEMAQTKSVNSASTPAPAPAAASSPAPKAESSGTAVSAQNKMRAAALTAWARSINGGGDGGAAPVAPPKAETASSDPRFDATEVVSLAPAVLTRASSFGSVDSAGSDSTPPIDNTSEHVRHSVRKRSVLEESPDLSSVPGIPEEGARAKSGSGNSPQAKFETLSTISPWDVRNNQSRTIDDIDLSDEEMDLNPKRTNPLSCLGALSSFPGSKSQKRVARPASPSSDAAIMSESGMSQQQRNSQSSNTDFAPESRSNRRRLFGWLKRSNRSRVSERSSQRPQHQPDSVGRSVPFVATVSIANEAQMEQSIQFATPEAGDRNSVVPSDGEVPTELEKLVRLLTENPQAEVTASSSAEALQGLENFEREAELQKNRHEREIAELRHNLRATLRTATELKNLNRGYGLAQKELSEELLQTQASLTKVRKENVSLQELLEELSASRAELQSLREKNQTLLDEMENGRNQNLETKQKFKDENEILRTQLIQLSKAEQEVTQMRTERDTYLKQVSDLKRKLEDKSMAEPDPEKATAIDKLENEKKSLLSQIFNLKELIKSREESAREKEKVLVASERENAERINEVQKERDNAITELIQLKSEKGADSQASESDSRQLIVSLQEELASSKQRLSDKSTELEQMRKELSEQKAAPVQLSSDSRLQEQRDVSPTGSQQRVEDLRSKVRKQEDSVRAEVQRVSRPDEISDQGATDRKSEQEIKKMEAALRESDEQVKRLQIQLSRARQALKKKNRGGDSKTQKHDGRPILNVPYDGSASEEEMNQMMSESPLELGQLLSM